MSDISRIAAGKTKIVYMLASCALALMLGLQSPLAGAAPTTTISDNPMVVVTPTHPQVLLLLNNSQSMDGTLSGAIMTGAAGTFSKSDPGANGFTPPVSNGYDSSDKAQYTVSNTDNSPSRMNVAKASIKQILADYAATNDFGLMTLGTSGSPGLYTTWVYYMSGAGGFTFTDDKGTNTYPNPCKDISSGPCTSLAGRYGSGVTSLSYLIAAGASDGTSTSPGSSDDPRVNDVLYAPSSLPSVAVVYGGPNPPTPFPPNYDLTAYNNGNILETYTYSTPSGGARQTGPTNAGYVPYGPETLYARRGFGYYNSVTNTATLQMPVAVDSTARQASFAALLAPETNNASSKEIKSNAVNAATAGMLETAYTYYTGTKKPVTNTGCTAKRYVVLISDGLPTWDLNGKAWPPLGSISAEKYGVTASIDSGSMMLTATNNTAVNDAITQIKALKGQKILTYVIGMGAGVNRDINPAAFATLRAMANAGGTTDFFPATSPADVSKAMVVILESIQAANASTTSAAVNSTNIRTNAFVYQGTFNSSEATNKDWTGDLLEFPLNSTGPVDTTTGNRVWSAQARLDTLNWDTGRRIVTYNPTTKIGGPFRWPNDSSDTSRIDTNQQALLMTSSTDKLGPDRLNYLRGDKSNEQTAGSFRKRTHLLGDIADSNPVYVGDAFGPYPDASYQSFQSGAKGRNAMIYAGANDGMLHAFEASTGNELYAFIPNGVFGNLINLTQPSYNTAHKFFVDGSPTAGDVYFSGSWHTILAGGLNNGGNSIYALDVTKPPSSSDTETSIAKNVLWEFTDTNLGKTFSRPATARIQTGSGSSTALQSVVIFGSGYNNADGNPWLYIVDAGTGTSLPGTPINLCDGQPTSVCDPTIANGLSSPAVVSPDGSGTVTVIYAGDLQGNLWKVDLTANKWTGQQLFKASQPITTTPVTSLHPNAPQNTGNMIYFGTGRYLGSPDISNGTTQSVYGIWDDDSKSVPTRSDLQVQTITQVTVTDALFNGVQVNGQNVVRTITSTPIDWTKKRGWYFDLPLTGERVVTDPRLVQQRLAFTTFTPSSDVCAGGGQSWLMVVNYATGGAFTKPEIDIYGDNSYAKVNDMNPVGVPLGDYFGASPTFIGNPDPTNPGDSKLISKSNGKIDRLNEKGGAYGRESWIQIQ